MSLSKQAQELTHAFIASQSIDVQKDIATFFDELLSSDIAKNALKTGDQATDFTLSNAVGKTVSLKDYLKKGPVVLSFYRGGWCPFCNLEFTALHNILPQIKALGATLIGISPETPDTSLSTIEKHQLKFEVLSDEGNEISAQYGLVMSVSEKMRPHYFKWGFDLPTLNGDETYELPLPATYIIGTDGIITADYINKDYTQRMEPEDIIIALENMSS